MADFIDINGKCLLSFYNQKTLNEDQIKSYPDEFDLTFTVSESKT